MSFAITSNGTSPTTTFTTRDEVSDISATLESSGPSDAHIPSDAPPNSDISGSSKKQRLSRGKITKPGQKSFSTPHLRGLMSSDEAAQQKRNKLGYQRISIACAHCRRRKIRCLVADGDPHSRCSNCIRLKKECVFYPVDQQSTLEDKSHSSGQTIVATGSSSGVSQSPPDVGPAMAFEDGRDQGFPIVPSNVQLGYADLVTAQSTGSGAASIDAQSFDPYVGGTAYRQQSFDQASAHSPWTGHGNFHFHPPATSSMGFPHAQYWRHNSIASPGDYASYSVDSTSTSIDNTNPYAFTQQRTDPSWAQHQQHPVRSMSYSQIEGYSQIDPYNTIHQSGIQQSASMRSIPPSIDTHGGSFTTHAPHSAPIQQYHQHGMQAFPMTHGQYNPQYHPSLSASPGHPSSLYRDSPRMNAVHEEHIDPAQSSPASGQHVGQPG